MCPFRNRIWGCVLHGLTHLEVLTFLDVVRLIARNAQRTKPMEYMHIPSTKKVSKAENKENPFFVSQTAVIFAAMNSQ